MQLGEYKALNKDSLHRYFLDYIDALDLPIIDYFAIGVQDRIHKKSASLMSRLDWQQTFKALNLAADDPVRKASFNTNTSIFTFDELDYQDSAGKEVMRQRRRHQIENGIVLMRRSLGHNFMLTLATGHKNFQPYKFLIDNQNGIKQIFNDFSKLVAPETKELQIVI